MRHQPKRCPADMADMPAGVPVIIMSPGFNVMIELINEIIVGKSNNISEVDPDCLSSPLVLE